MAKIFVPEAYEAGEEFYKNAEEYLRRNCADYLWVSNPQEPYTAWNCASLCGNGQIVLGRYRFCFGRILSRDDTRVVFSGRFFCGEHDLGCRSFTLDLSTPNGLLLFELSTSEDILEILDVSIKYLMPSKAAVLSGRPFSYTGGASFHAQMSFCELMNPNVTYLSFPEVELCANLLALDGAEIFCTPVSGSRIVFEKYACSCEQRKDKVYLGGWNYYLSVQGDFECQVTGLILGLYGGEYVEAEGALRFVAGQDALLANQELVCENGRPTTAWLSVRGKYHSSPSGSVLYRLKGGMLCPYDPIAAVYGLYSPPFPYMPWKNCSVESAQDGIAGENLLYEKRFQSLLKAQKQLKHEMCCEETAFTESGLCVGINPVTGVWNWVGIANMKGNALPDVRIGPVSESGRKAFLDKDCFVCACTEEEFQRLGASDRLSVEADGWQIGMVKGGWRDGMVFIMKYTTDFSVKERLMDNKAFVTLLEQAYDGKGEIQTGFEDFVHIVEDRAFQGTILLNAAAKPVRMTPETEMILKSADEIKTVYMAIRHGRISVKNNEVVTERSLISAYLHYKASPENVSKEGSFQTTGFSVTIRDSKVTEFYSCSELRIRRLMGEETGECCMVLNGMLEEAAGGRNLRYALASAVNCVIAESMVEQICVNDVQLLPKYGSSGAFALRGDMKFAQCEKIDIFSWEKLAYEQMLLIPDSQGSVREDGSHMRLISSRSEARSNSLAERFGPQVKSMLCSREGSPNDMGYRSINTPIRQEKPEKFYSALIWELNAGGSGSLGGNLPVSLHLITAWSGKKLYIGVREKDLMGLTLSGILGVGFGGMEIVEGKENANENREFMLKLCSIGIQFLKFTISGKSADLYIFGEHGKLGWYMGYGEVKTEPDKNGRLI